MPGEGSVDALSDRNFGYMCHFDISVLNAVAVAHSCHALRIERWLWGSPLGNGQTVE